MGGSGSGRDGWRTTVESCLRIYVNRFVREGIIRPGRWTSGQWIWRYPSGEKATIGYTADTTNMDTPVFRLKYRITRTGDDVDEVIDLVFTSPYFGGTRFWFRCPRCGRRVGALYFPNGGRYFWCRRCYNLTYQSCNESHQYDALYAILAQDMGIPPYAVKKVLSRGYY